MYRKYLTQIAVIGLKYTFGIEHELAVQIVIIFMLIVSSGRYAIMYWHDKMAGYIPDIKLYWSNFIAQLSHILKQLNKKPEHEESTLLYHINPFDEHYRMKNRFQWHFHK